MATARFARLYDSIYKKKLVNSYSLWEIKISTSNHLCRYIIIVLRQKGKLLLESYRSIVSTEYLSSEALRENEMDIRTAEIKKKTISSTWHKTA